MAFSVRLGEWYFPKSDLELVLAIFSAPAVAVPIFIYFGLYYPATSSSVACKFVTY
jgi:hypothetical protein